MGLWWVAFQLQPFCIRWYSTLTHSNELLGSMLNQLVLVSLLIFSGRTTSNKDLKEVNKKVHEKLGNLEAGFCCLRPPPPCRFYQNLFAGTLIKIHTVLYYKWLWIIIIHVKTSANFSVFRRTEGEFERILFKCKIVQFLHILLIRYFPSKCKNPTESNFHQSLLKKQMQWFLKLQNVT